MVRKIKGKALMLRLNGATIALATSCNFSVTMNLISARTKRDSGDYYVPSHSSWSATSNNIVGASASNQHTQDALMTLMHRKQPVDLEVMLAANPHLGVPEPDWSADSIGGSGFAPYGGKAYIKEVAVNTGVDGYAALSVHLTGIGELNLINETNAI